MRLILPPAPAPASGLSLVVSYLATGLAACVAHAGFSQAVITPPGGFVQAGAYPITCACTPNPPGGDMQAGYGLGADFQEQAFAGVASASASAVNTTPGVNGPLNQSISGSAGLGFVRAQGSNAYTDEARFANAILNGGWNETFTVSQPSLTGQSGFMVFRLRARGQFHTQGLTGSAVIDVTTYKNNVQVLWNPYYSQEGSDVGSAIGTAQAARWGLASFGQPDNRNVDAFVTMSVPITFGTPFTLGVYVRAIAGQRSSGGFNAPSRGSLDFSAQGVEWAGITGVLNAGGGNVSGSTIVSGSGTNWLPPIGACDTITPDSSDLDDFLAVFAGGPSACSTFPTPGCNDIDFNNDGFSPDSLDLDAFLSRLAGGACLQ
jgi:hypothetical protein